MHPVLYDKYDVHFPVKFPQISPSKHHTNPGVTFVAVGGIMGRMGRDTALFFTHAHKCAPGVTRDGMTSQIAYANTGTKCPKSRIATNAAYFLYIKIGVM